MFNVYFYFTLKGDFPCNEDVPFTPGHEFVGTIQEIGISVRVFKVGDKVAVDPNNGCAVCNHCHNGTYHYCLTGGINNTLGIFRNGGWSTHVLVPQSQVSIDQFYLYFKSNFNHFWYFNYP